MAAALRRRFDRRERKLAAALVASLDPAEREVLGTVHRNLHVFGRPGGGVVVVDTIVSLTPKRRTPRMDIIRREDLAPVVTRLQRLGWLRFAPHAGHKDGLFWLSDVAEDIFDSAGVKGTDLFRAPAELEGTI
jgi:hypothetical protein